MSETGVATRRNGWRTTGRVLVSLVASAALVCWLLLSLFLFVFRCDESCGAGQAGHWRYPAQLVLAGIGAPLGLAAAVLAFTDWERAYRRCLVGSVACAVVWWAWVFLVGGF